jgi:hypothetical protein
MKTNTNEFGFSIVELAIAAAVSVALGAIVITAATGTSAVISSKGNVAKNAANTYNSTTVLGAN